MNDLVIVNQVPGFFNYTRPVKNKEKFQLIQMEQLEEEIFAPLVRNNSLRHQLSYRGNLKTDLPITSDFGEIKNPYQLIYARLEGLQYAIR